MLNNFKLKNFIYRNLKIRNIIFIFLIWSMVIPFIFIFIYALKKYWFDGMSVAAAIYIALPLLILIFDIAEFKTWTKLKKLFAIKKENQEELTSFEKAQMRILSIKDDIDQKEEKEDKKQKKETSRFISILTIIYGMILLCVSLPFCF